LTTRNTRKQGRNIGLRKNDCTMIVGGTSLAVYPAAGLLDYFRGDNLVIINKTATKADMSANLVIREPIGKVLSAAVRKNGGAV